MDREELVRCIDNKLKSFDMPSFNDLKSNIQEYLIKIEDEIQNIFLEKRETIEKYRESKINVLSLVKKVGIARQTIYNNREILEKYIHINQHELEKEDVFTLLQEKAQAINELNDTINKLKYRDLNEQLYIDKIELLEEENKNLVKEVESLNKRNVKIMQDMNVLQNQIRRAKNENKVINLE